MARETAPVPPAPPARVADNAPARLLQGASMGGGGGAPANTGGGCENSSHSGGITPKRGSDLTHPLELPEQKKNSDGAPPSGGAAPATVAQLADALGLLRPRCARLAGLTGAPADAKAPLSAAGVAAVARAVGVEPSEAEALLLERAERPGMVQSLPRNPSVLLVRLEGDPAEVVAVRVAARLRDRWRVGMPVLVRPVSSGVWEPVGPVPKPRPQ